MSHKRGIAATVLILALMLTTVALAAGRAVSAGRKGTDTAGGCTVTNLVKVAPLAMENGAPQHEAGRRNMGEGAWDETLYTAMAPVTISLTEGGSFQGYAENGDQLPFDFAEDTGSGDSAITLAQPGTYAFAVTPTGAFSTTKFLVTVVPEEDYMQYYDGHVVERSASPILLDGAAVTPTAYTLIEPNGDGTNYVQLRDLAKVLANSNGKFDVGWDGATGTVVLTTGKAYTQAAVPEGSASALRYATRSNVKVTVDGHPMSALCYAIDGNNYFKLRDLGKELGFAVSWDDAAKSVRVVTPPTISLPPTLLPSPTPGVQATPCPDEEVLPTPGST